MLCAGHFFEPGPFFWRGLFSYIYDSPEVFSLYISPTKCLAYIRFPRKGLGGHT